MQHSLFDDLEPQVWNLSDDARLALIPDLLEARQSEDLFEQLRQQIEWQQSTIQIAGRAVQIPRLNAWYGDLNANYHYSGKSFKPLPWIEALEIIRDAVQRVTMLQFNSVLANLYRDGQDSVSWHADNEKPLGPLPTIASVSLGAARKFQLKHQTNKQIKRLDLVLPHNSLLIMSGALQQFWQHQVPKTRRPVGSRVNLTFRQVLTEQSTSATVND